MLTEVTQTAHSRFVALDNLRSVFISNCERYAQFTIPKICPPPGYQQKNGELLHDYQSLGAQGTNHLSNKLMLALFAPSRPFFRLDPGPRMKAQLEQNGVKEADVAAMLAVAEKNATSILDQRAIRPKMYEAMKHIIVTGNCLMIFDKDSLRVLGLKKYVVKRAADGKLVELVICEKQHFTSLTQEAKTALEGKPVHADPQGNVNFYRWVILKDDGRYHETQWVGDCHITGFSGAYKPEDMPYHAITWDLASGDDYGTGLVEDYAGDFAALSMMAESTVNAAILASEYRYLVNPGGLTQVEDMNASRNGDALPGAEGDIHVLTPGNQNNLGVNLQIAEMYINRIGRGFLLGSAVTRDAERVTAEEIRMTAMELETALGGAYSRIAADVQVPMAGWLMKQAKQPITGSDIKPTVITGMDALSRAGDRDNLMLFLQDAGILGALPPAILGKIDVDAFLAAFAAARGLAMPQYVLSQQVQQQNAEASRQQAMQDTADAAAIEANANQ